MALSGSAYKSFARHRLVLEWTGSQNVASNYTDVTVKVYLQSMDGYGQMIAPVSNAGSVTINGAKKTFSASSNLSAHQKKLLTTQTQRVTHASDGKKTFSISATFNINVTFAGTFYGNQTASGSWTLNTIPRASSMSLSTTSIEYGKAVTFKIYRASSSFTHTINYNWNGNSGTVTSKTTSTSVTWTVPNSFMNYIPNGTSTYGTLYLDTYSGSTKIGSKSYKLTTRVPSSVIPTLSSLTVAETNAQVTAVAGAGVFLQSLSRLKFTIGGAAGSYGSTIKSYRIEFDGSGWNSSTVTTGAINGVGTITAKAYVKDSRGRQSATKTLNVAIVAYKPPTFTSVGVARTSWNATDLQVIRQGTFTKIGSNNLALTFYYKLPTTTTWTTYADGTLTATATPFTGNIAKTTGIVFPSTQTYDVKVEARDTLQQVATWQGKISTANVAMSWSKNGIGIGKIIERGVLDVEGASYFNGDVNIDKGGRVILSKDIYAAQGGGMNFNNSDIVGINGLYFGATAGTIDPANNDGEGLIFPKSGTIIPNGGVITDKSGWDNLYVKDGIGYLNGTPVFRPMVKVWTGESYMNSGQSATPSTPIAECANGWLLVWSDYDVGEGINNFQWAYTIIPKLIKSGNSMLHAVPNNTGTGNIVVKTLYTDGKIITGHDANDDPDGSNDVVLREVYAF